MGIASADREAVIPSDHHPSIGDIAAMKRKTNTAAKHHRQIEAAITALIASRDRALLDTAAWLSERLPQRRQRKALKAIVAAI
jgi:phosphoenolpyruvate carboxylase